MAKAKYKIGMLVETRNATFAKIEGVVTRSNGYAYLLEGSDVEYGDDAIVAAYKPLAVRKTNSKPKAKKAKKVVEVQDELPM